MIRLEQVSMGYLPGKEVLKDISFTLSPGSFHFLSGPSGAGKTSLLRMLALTQPAGGGRILFFDKDVTRLPRDILPKLRQRIGMVYQDFRLMDHMTVGENIALPLKIAGEDQGRIDRKVDELLNWIDMADFRHAKPELLSGGQKQRVAIARAVVNSPDLLLADEPSGNLDTALSVKFMHLFEVLNKSGTTIIIATHQENLISRFNYPVLRLKNGQLQVQAPVSASA